MPSNAKNTLHNISYNSANLISTEDLEQGNGELAVKNPAGNNEELNSNTQVLRKEPDPNDSKTILLDVGSPTKSLLMSIMANDNEATGSNLNQLDLYVDYGGTSGDNYSSSYRADEHTPLLGNSDNNRYKSLPMEADLKSFWKIFSLRKTHQYIISMLALLVFVSLLLLLLHRTDFGEMAQSSVDLDLREVSLVDVSDDSINLHVTGAIKINYNNIENMIYRNIAKMSSMIIGSIYVQLDKVQLFIRTNTAQRKLHVCTLSPQRIQVYLKQDDITDLDIITNVDILEENIVKFLGLIENMKNDVPLYITALSNVTIDGNLLHWTKKGVLIETTYNLEKNKLDIPIAVKDLQINSQDSMIEVYSKIEIISQFPLNLTLNGMYWDFLVNGCDEKLISIGEWKSNQISIEPSLPTVFEINGVITEVPSEILDKCTNTDTSPLNSILNHIFIDHSIPAYIRTAQTSSNSLPNWLFYILHENPFKLNIPIPSQRMILEDFNISTLELDIPKSDSGCLEFNANSNSSMQMYFPALIPLTIPKAEFNFTLFDNSSNIILSGWTTEYSTFQVFDTDTLLDVIFESGDINFKMDDPTAIGNIISLVLNEDFNSTFHLDIDVSFIEVSSNLLSTSLYDLSIKDINFDLNQYIAYLDLDPLLNELAIIVQDIVFVSSTPNSIDLSIDVGLVNPNSYSFNFPEDTIKISVLRNNSHFCNFEVTDLFLPAQSEANITLSAGIFVDSIDNKLIVNDLISKYISGFLDLAVDFTHISAKENENLNKLLQNITIPHIKIPSVKFEHDDIRLGAQPLSRGTNPSPFLMSAVIHILTSELELVVFNPVSNAELFVDLYHAEAKFGDQILGSLARRELLLVPPGVYHSPRLPVKLELGIGMDILRRAMNGNIEVNATALFNVKLDMFEADLIYYGSNLKSDVRL